MDRRGDVDDSCAICMDSLRVASEENAVTECKHRFHAACLRRWVEQHRGLDRDPSCPVCRARLCAAPGSLQMIGASSSRQSSEIESLNEALAELLRADLLQDGRAFPSSRSSLLAAETGMMSPAQVARRQPPAGPSASPGAVPSLTVGAVTYTGTVARYLSR